jgi:dolichol kinase
VSYTTTLVLTILTALGAFFSERDITPLVTVTSLSWGETAASTAFYYWKARSENRIKLTKAMVEDWADKYGIEAVATLASIVLND